MDDNQTMGERLEDEMREKGLNQAQLANGAGVSPSLISDMIQGKDRRYTHENIIAICRYLDISADWLLGLSSVPALDPDLRSVCKYTGLSSKAVKNLHNWANENPVIIEPDGTEVLDGDHKPCIKALDIILRLESGKGLLYALRDYLLASHGKVYTLPAGKTEPVEGDAFIRIEEGLIKHMRRKDIERWLWMDVLDWVQHLKREFKEFSEETKKRRG